MKAWKWAGIAFVLLAVALGYLARPIDDLAGVRRLNPVVASFREFGPENPLITSYRFEQPAEVVLAALPVKSRPLTGRLDYRVDLPSGRVLTLSPLDARSCFFDIYEDRRPWYLRTWTAIKVRLGL